jgi:hypothetical protein
MDAQDEQVRVVRESHECRAKKWTAGKVERSVQLTRDDGARVTFRRGLEA